MARGTNGYVVSSSHNVSALRPRLSPDSYAWSRPTSRCDGCCEPGGRGWRRPAVGSPICEPGVVEAASLEGYYTYVSMIMNTARSPLPTGAKPALAPFPK